MGAGGLYRLRRRGFFSLCRVSKEAVGEYRRSNSPLLSFVEEACSREPQGLTTEASEYLDTMFKRYVEWCKDNGFKAASKTRLRTELPEAADCKMVRTKLANGSRPWRVDGLALLPQEGEL